MKNDAWAVARRLAQAALMDQITERSGSISGTKTSLYEALPHARQRLEDEVCVYCGGNDGRKVGQLALSGKVIFCKKCRKQYQSDKAWENGYKRDLNL